MTAFRQKGRKKAAAAPLAVLIEVEKKLGPLPESLRPRIVDQGPCGDGFAHRWSALKLAVVDNRFSLLSRECLDCGFWTASMREAASYSEAV